jgi:hypothetical protein
MRTQSENLSKSKIKEYKEGCSLDTVSLGFQQTPRVKHGNTNYPATQRDVTRDSSVRESRGGNK